MIPDLLNYSITPIAFPAEKEIEFTIRPLGDHAAFRRDEEYTLQLLPIDDCDSKDIQTMAVTAAEDGCIRFKTVLHGEKEYYARILHTKDGKQKRLLKLSLRSQTPFAVIYMGKRTILRSFSQHSIMPLG